MINLQKKLLLLVEVWLTKMCSENTSFKNQQLSLYVEITYQNIQWNVYRIKYLFIYQSIHL